MNLEELNNLYIFSYYNILMCTFNEYKRLSRVYLQVGLEKKKELNKYLNIWKYSFNVKRMNWIK